MSELSQSDVILEGAKAIAHHQNPRSGYTRSIMWLVLASFMWGTVGVSSALLNRVETTPPLTIGFLRLAFSSPFLIALAYFSSRHSSSTIRRKDFPFFAGMGLAMAGYQVFYFAAIPISSVTLVVVTALCSAPLIVALLSIPVFHERLTLQVIIALCLALSGTLLLVLGGGKSGEIFKPEYLLGALLALGAGFSYSCLTIFSKLATHHTTASPSQAVAIAFTTGALLLLPVAFFSGNLKLDLQPGVWFIAAYMGLVPTGLAYVIFQNALRKATATMASITTLIEPAVAALLAWLLLGENISVMTGVGGLLLVSSVWLLSRR